MKNQVLPDVYSCGLTADRSRRYKVKKQKLLAALLCVAMAVTSVNVNVMAANADILTGDTQVMTASDELAEDALISAEDDHDTLADSVGTVEEAVLSGNDTEAPEELKADPNAPLADETNDLSADKSDERLSTPFDETATTLTLKSTYSSLEEWNLHYVVIPACVTTIPADTALFQNNKQIESVQFESTNTLTDIEAEAFRGSAIKSFTMPRTVKTIEDGTFAGCKALTSFTLSNVETIGDEAFAGCISLTNSGFAGGEYVTAIGDYAFQNTGFTSLTLNGMKKNAISVGTGAFADCLSMTRAELPNGFLTVPEYCFSGCKKLTTVVIGTRTVTVAEHAFQDCEALTTVSFANIETIGTNAFDGCKALKKIDLPESVFTIEENAFSRCDSLTELYIRYKNKQTGIADDLVLPESLVYFPSQLTIYGCGGLVESYANNHKINYKSLLSMHKLSLLKACEGYIGAYSFSRAGGKTTGKTIEAAAGEMVSFQFDSKGDWVVYRVYDDKDIKKEEVPFTYIGGDSTKRLFQFKMPDRDSVIKVDPVAKSALSKGKFTYELTGYGNTYTKRYTAAGKQDGYETGTTGNKAQIEVTLHYDGKEFPLDYWMMSYRSAVKTIATVNGRGVITATGKGATMLGFTPLGSKEITFPLYVNADVNVESLDFDQDKLEYDFSGSRYGTISTVTRQFKENDGTVTRTVPLIKYNKEDLNNINQVFDIHLIAIDDHGADVNVKATWKIDDKNIATLKNESNFDNVNTITVKKGCSGETYIRATVKSNGVTRYAYAVLQVVDKAPTTTKNEYMVNTQCVYVASKDDETLNSDGCEVEIIATEEYPIDPERMSDFLYLSTKVNDTNTFKGIKVTYVGKSTNNERGYIYRLSVVGGKYGDAKVNGLKEGKSITYTGNTQMYMRGVFEGSDDYFYIPLKKLIIFNQKLKPNVSTAGSINTFYNYKCYYPEAFDWAGWEEILGDKAKKDVTDDYFEQNKFTFINKTIGEISVLQSISKSSAKVDYDGVYNPDEYGEKGNKEIADYVEDIAGDPDLAFRVRLLSEKNYAYFCDNSKRDKREVRDGKYFDSFANNFDVLEAKSGVNFIIRRSANEMAKIDGKDVTSGYLLIYYKGYKDPIAYKLKLKITNKGPAYSLSPSTASDSWYNYSAGNDNEIPFEIRLFKKNTTKSVLEFDDLEDDYPYVNQQKSTHRNDCVFNKDVDVKQYKDTDNNAMTVIKNQTYSGKSTAVIVIKKTWWDKEQSYNFVVNEMTRDPKGKFSSNKIGLNNWFEGEDTERTITYKVDLGPCTMDVLDGPDPLPGKKQDPDEFDKLNVTVESAGDGYQAVNIKAYVTDRSIKKGNYTYTFTPQVTYPKKVITLKPVKFTVSVTSAQPTIKLTGTNFNYNVSYPGIETYKVNATFGSVPQGGKNEDFVLSSTGAELIPTAKTGTAAYEMADKVRDSFRITKFEYNEKTKKFDFFCKLDEVDGYSSFNCKFNLTGLTINDAEIKPLKITIKSHAGVPSILLTGSGKINTVDAESFVTIKPTIKNLVNPDIESITYSEWDNEAGIYAPDKDNRFNIVRETDDDKDTTLAYISATHTKDSDGMDTCTNENHKLRLKYKIGWDTLETAEFGVKPTQTTPSLKTSPTSAVFYDNSDPENRVSTVEVTKTSVLNAVIDDEAESGGFKVSDENPVELRSAFEVSYDPDGADPVPASRTAKTLKAGKVTIKCVAPELLTAGTKYKLILEPEYKGQFVKTKAKTVTVTVSVIK